MLGDKFVQSNKGLSPRLLGRLLDETAEDIIARGYKKLLFLPPDISRAHSYGGIITSALYSRLSPYADIDVMPAIGTHLPLTDDEKAYMFPGIPRERFLVHDWQKDTEKVGVIPGERIKELSEGLLDYPVDVEVDRRLLHGGYDLILSIGQVVPHEVVGMANYTKNVFVGCGGASMINGTHFLSAVYGIERVLGRTESPVRKVFDDAEQFIADIPLYYMLTVVSGGPDGDMLHGLFMSRGRRAFEEAAALAEKTNMTALPAPIKKAVVYLEPEEFRSTWVGNKAIYRTRMAIADGGELIIIAPGVRTFGETRDLDALIRKYGYHGRDAALAATKNSDMAANLSAASHLMHGSSDGRFSITYCPGGLSREEIENAGYNYMPLEEALEKYDISKLKDGYNTVDGEEIFYVSNPAIGLWKV